MWDEFLLVWYNFIWKLLGCLSSPASFLLNVLEDMQGVKR